MTQTIGNPLSWGARHLSAAGHALGDAARHVGGDEAQALPRLQPLEMSDLTTALRLGAQDFAAMRSDAVMAAVLYPIIGVFLIWATLHQGALPLIFPLVSGFALVGPVAALGFYELSRRREAGEDPSWMDAFGVVKAPGFGGIVLLSIGLAALFIAWLITAWAIHRLTMGAAPNDSASAFLDTVFSTEGGRRMVMIGLPVGFVFALVALSVSVISFPLMLDRDIGLPRAVITSVRVVRQNPAVMLAWGAIVVAGLLIGALPFLLGLAVTLPILGHATWHLYRRAVI